MLAALHATTPAHIAPDAATLGVLTFLVVLAALLAGPAVQSLFERRSRRAGDATVAAATSPKGHRARAAHRRAA